MPGETDLIKMLKTLKPLQHPGEYVFCVVNDLSGINPDRIVSIFREAEGITIIIPKQLADGLQLEYSFIASWITLSVHSSLNAVGLTAAFSKALSDAGISCNVVAAFHHDHIFVDKNDAEKAMAVLNFLSTQ
jgi:uncharacterized protein